MVKITVVEQNAEKRMISNENLNLHKEMKKKKEMVKMKVKDSFFYLS